MLDVFGDAGDHQRVDDAECGDGIHAEELADHDAVHHRAYGGGEG